MVSTVHCQILLEGTVSIVFKFCFVAYFLQFVDLPHVKHTTRAGGFCQQLTILPLTGSHGGTMLPRVLRDQNYLPLPLHFGRN